MAVGQGGQLDLGTYINRLKSQSPVMGQALQEIEDAINRVGINASVSPVGDVSAPKAPDSVSVKVGGEQMHIAINHTGALNRGIQYFTEISTTSSFGQPIVYHHGTSRTPPPINLPTYLDDGETKQTYWVRSYAQNPGGPPSGKTLAQGSYQMGGSTALTLLPSTGSGTAPNNGQSAGQGLGTFQKRNS